MHTDSKIPKVLIVDDDPAIRVLLRKWLSGARYQLDEASDGREAIEKIRVSCPNLIVTDRQMPYMDGLELCRWLRDQHLPEYVYVLMVSGCAGSEEMIRGLEAGADDFLKKPIDKGELLARLRAGMRVLELESRLNLLAKTDPLTGLISPRTFSEALPKLWQDALDHDWRLSCVMIEVDHLKRIHDVYGTPVADETLRRIAKMLAGNCRSSDVVARHDDDKFVVLLPHTREDGAVIWADRMRQAIGALELTVDRKTLPVTASVGVAARSPQVAGPRELLELAEQSLLIAVRSGRDRVVGHETMQEFGSTENMPQACVDALSGVVASDVMTNIVAQLRETTTVGRAAEHFLRFRISSAPVVDDEGRLVGILSERDVMSVMLWPDAWNTPVSQVMKPNVVTYPESTPVMTIYEFLCRVPIRAVVIVDDGRPTGVLSRSSLVRWFNNAMLVQMADQPGDAPQADESDPLRSTADALVAESQRLARLLHSDERDMLPAVVGGASRMQEMVNDLLAFSPHLRRCSLQSAQSAPTDAPGVGNLLAAIGQFSQ
ncbi:MAG: diguanylate cyclase [Planctomycetales bacterium]|nr:diguanylate cyclase [Planctomycetales bacterium]